MAVTSKKTVRQCAGPWRVAQMDCRLQIFCRQWSTIYKY